MTDRTADRAPGEPDPVGAEPVPFDAIVVAAGTSTRMDGIDKLIAEVGGRPVLAHAVLALAATPGAERLAVVVRPERIDAVATADWLPSSVVAVVPGGSRRQVSVAAGLTALGDVAPDRIVLIHDGARPVISPALVARVAAAADAHGAAIPVLPLAETVKRVEGDVVAETLDRSRLGLAQTPQGFRVGLLREAYARLDPDGPEEWTDEAGLLESCTIPVHVVLGEPSNLKVTLPGDLARVEAMLAGGDLATRVGIGRDRHPFGPGTPLALAGLTIERAPRLWGHSDGDVALHAVADALLGATGQGDLGRLFPAGPETPAGIASADLVHAVVERLRAAGWRPASVDVTIVAGRPRLAGHLDAMRVSIAGLLGLPAAAVSVKASTGNLGGDEGAGRAIAAQAVAVAVRLEDGPA